MTRQTFALIFVRCCFERRSRPALRLCWERGSAHGTITAAIVRKFSPRQLLPVCQRKQEAHPLPVSLSPHLFFWSLLALIPVLLDLAFSHALKSVGHVKPINKQFLLRRLWYRWFNRVTLACKTRTLPQRKWYFRQMKRYFKIYVLL